jgi:protein subunit release factor A
MRQLNKEERELTQKNVKRNEEEEMQLAMNIAYNEDLIKKQKELRQFDDKWRNYLRSIKDKDDQNLIKLMKEELENKKELIKISEDQLKKGVEQRIPSGV